MEPTKKQQKEFWERCGLRHKKVNGFDYWYNSRDHLEAICTPPIDLNNLFKYAVPQVRKYLNAQSEVGSIDTVKYPFHDFMKRWSYAVAIKDKDPALALFWAIYEVIHERH